MSGPDPLRPAPVAGALGSVLTAALLSLALWPAPAAGDALTPASRPGVERPERAQLAAAPVPAPAAAVAPAPAPPVAPAPAPAPTRTSAPAPVAAKPATPVAKAPAPASVQLPAPAPAPVPPPPVPAAATGTSAGEYEDRLVAAVNAERRARGLAPLQRDGCADGFARTQAGRMAAAGSMWHQDLNPVLDTCGGYRAAENVGYGDISPERMVELWMASASHRKQVLEPALTHLGSGAVRRDDGRWYAAHVFLGR